MAWDAGRPAPISTRFSVLDLSRISTCLSESDEVLAKDSLSLRFRNAYVGRGNPKLLQEFRLIVNYELNLL
jgi:hypothetical protein